MAVSNNWIIEIRDGAQGATGTVRERYGFEAGDFNMVAEIGGTATSRTVKLGQIEGPIRLITVPWGDVNTYRTREITWRGIMPELEPDDIVVLYTRGFKAFEVSSNFYPRGGGRAEVVRNFRDRSNEPQDYRVVGLEESDFDTSVPDNTPLDEGQDIGQGLFHYFLNEFGPDPVIVGAAGDYEVAVTNTGKVNANYGKLNEILDGLVMLGKTGNADVNWVVRPDRTIAFGARGGGVLSIDETTPGTNVQYPPKQSRDVVTGVRWLIADGSSDRMLFVPSVGVPLDTNDMLSHLVDSEVTDYRERVTPLSPPEGMQPFRKVDVTYTLESGTLNTSFVGETEDDPATLDRVHDGNPTSYIVTDGFTEIRATFPNIGLLERDIVMVSLHFKEDVSSDGFQRVLTNLRSRAKAASPELSYMLQGRLNPDGPHEHVEGSPEFDERIVFGDRARDRDVTIDDTGWVTLVLSAVSGSPQRWAIADFRIWTLATDDLDAAAELEFRVPATETVEARLDGQQEMQPFVDLTRHDSEVLGSLQVEEYELVVGGQEGTRTIVRIGSTVEPAVEATARRVRNRDVAAETSAFSKALRRP